ncbi:MAG: hypothetical protein I8H75_00600 [Myxococcaceae bacterium]|nr:hypothetical protein [Myxococcaceae bacterium]MBH2005841.1 hypothetical protein [Myxococcaceae bacterium]
MNHELIQKLSLQEPKTLLQRMVKLQEETGELAQEVLIAQNASGTQHKTAGADGIAGECVDIVLVALSIYFSQGKSPQDLAEYTQKKLEKWQHHQSKPLPGSPDPETQFP